MITYILLAVLYIFICSIAAANLWAEIKTTRFNSWNVHLFSKIVHGTIFISSFFLTTIVLAESRVL